MSSHTYMDDLAKRMSTLKMSSNKRSYVDAFLAEEVVEKNTTKESTRLQLARALNRRDKAYQNMKKTGERIRSMTNRMREQEAEFDAAKEEVQRLRELLRDDN